MTTAIIHTCDRCNKVQPTRQESGGHTPLWIVSIICEPVDYGARSQYHSPNQYQRQELCRPCVDELGVMLPLIRAVTEERPVTIDDMIRGIVEQTLQEQR